MHTLIQSTLLAAFKKKMLWITMNWSLLHIVKAKNKQKKRTNNSYSLLGNFRDALLTVGIPHKNVNTVIIITARVRFHFAHLF